MPDGTPRWIVDGVEFGLLLPAGQAQLEAGGTLRALVALAREAERLGFASIWAGDSLSRPRIEPLTLLTAVAQATERVTVGTAVLLPAHRNPVQTAMTLASVDLISEGRLAVGVGAGFPGFSEREFELAGVAFRTRFPHLDDVVTLWRELWTGQPQSFHGKVLHYDWLPPAVRPARPGGPPIWLGGATPAALRRTALRYDGWLPYPPDPADYASGLATIRAASDRTVTPSLFLTVYVDPDPRRGRRVLEDYAQATYRRPLAQISTIQATVTGPISQVAATVRRYAEAGAEHVLLRVGSLEPGAVEQQLPLLAEVIAGERKLVGAAT
ncbi:Flavin-dependent oxidoreductase, luciferase family (includes alkanesulfonate monooxygenase SsuD and methylene tetrahydromethanopterin reductase) [Amycolatopsis rubida]|uniref:Flavin-dependent oxidoreductase, luciferase family (Includes alkanesulfonate monooxygenase SsuD and methylene tetrahydromethanopterin reductase) n=1 Tax=Amycolatopsis rubida TaxID=112413 RepID=A0A1I5WSW6_9PSEU|nr:Flavin-dependent oxidoreductase, luciferase family (includes alkanesulfonate monooxygenase SsuD and methylene tetrahydromethanopterin reductase) [Amycolatopsis rubida]